MDHFVLHSEYQPTGDQPQAIDDLVKGFREGNQFQTLLGVTGSGKTFTMANVIQALNRPTLIISHNKTLAGQLYGEMKEFFPENAVEYFVSYYDYYQPEAYIPSSDTYIAKDSMINEEIDKLRLSATASLAERRDVVVVASVSCIYGLGSPEEFKGMSISLRPGMEKDRDEVIKELIAIQYTRNDLSLERCNFRVRGDTVEVYPAQGGEYLIRIEWFGDEIDRICEVEQLTGRVHASLSHVMIWPADARDGILQRDRELFQASEFCQAGGAAADIDGLLPGRFSDHCGRVTHDDPADRGHVPRRPVAQADAGGVRLPPAVGIGQPAAEF